MQGHRQALNKVQRLVRTNVHLIIRWKQKITYIKYKIKIMKYIVYLTTNIKNNKIYVGVHKTEDPDKFDGYLGNGVNRNSPSSIKNPKEPFQYAVKKYGFDSFRRSTIRVFDTQQEALDLEGEIVDEDFIKRKDTYNIALGGGLPPLLNKVVYQYTLEGDFIKEWFSIHEAALNLNIAETAIGKAVLYKRTSAGFLWSNCKFDKLNTEEFNKYEPKVAVHCYDSTGEFYKSFSSMSECTKFLECCLSNVQRALKIGTAVKGYYLSLKLTPFYEKPKVDRLTGEVHQYNLDGSYIQSFNSIREAESKLGVKLSGINDAIKLNNSYYKGYLWARGEKLDSIKPYETPKSKSRKIGQYTMEGELVKVFNTVRECRKKFPNVSKVLNGSAKHCHNFIFKYLE